MQSGRLFEIVYILMNKGTVTARELSDKFEVSVRTIYRDIDTLSTAGVPVYSKKGKNGGISLLDNFVISKAFVTKEEQQEIVSAIQALKVLDPVKSTSNQSSLLKKMTSLFQIQTDNWLEIDFSDWGNNGHNEFELFKKSIIFHNVVSFDYYNRNLENKRRIVYPVKLMFKHRSWYLSAYCTERKAMRTFKLTRIKNVVSECETFNPEILDTAEYSHESNALVNFVHLKMVIHSSQAYRVYDEFDEHQVLELPNGDFLIECYFPEDEWVYGTIMSYGDYIQVLEPEHVSTIILTKLKKMIKNFS